ncbi:calcium-binding protein [Actinoplanes sp. NPDC049118]|uniref:calcium-binding protein n=1 Tax=Actinoplanes sp. NPDC049118 TaxID=3155769 RepID=UPI0033CF3B39
MRRPAGGRPSATSSHAPSARLPRHASGCQDHSLAVCAGSRPLPYSHCARSKMGRDMRRTTMRGYAVAGLLGLVPFTAVWPAGPVAAATVGVTATVADGTLDVSSDGANSDDITVSGPVTDAAGSWVTVESRHGILPQAGCQVTDPRHVRCGTDAFTRIVVSSGDGADRVTVETNMPTVVHGGDGSDGLFDRAGNNELWGDGGPDTLYGGAGNDSLYGGDDYDALYGNAGDDVMDGGRGGDFFYADAGQDGADVMRGGADADDLVDYSRRSASVTVTLDGVANDGAAGENDLVGADVDYIWGGQGDDRLIGNDRTNWISGRFGNDHVEGLGGDDIVWGGNGDDHVDGGDGDDGVHGGYGKDVVLGGAGNDRLTPGDYETGSPDTSVDVYNGGPGTDVLDYASSPRGVTVRLDGVANDGTSGETDNALELENLEGSRAGDTLIGDGGANRIKGAGGDDVIDGGSGSDVLNGGDGRDQLRAVDGVGNQDRVDGGSRENTEKDNDGCEVDPDDVVSNCAQQSIKHP